MEKINSGHTNISFKKNNTFFQQKIKNGFNHKINYKELKEFDFVPKLIEDTSETIEWEWIEGKTLDDPTNEDLIKIAQILKQIHNSKIQLPKSNIRQRINEYRKILKEKNIKIDIIEKLFKKINMILKNINRNTPIHGDVWGKNIIKTNDKKLYFIDWEYAHMGDIHFELAYIIESYNFSKQKEDVLLKEYKYYSDELLKKHKVLINYLIILWAYSQKELPYDIKGQIKRLENLSKEYL